MSFCYYFGCLRSKKQTKLAYIKKKLYLCARFEFLYSHSLKRLLQIILFIALAFGWSGTIEAQRRAKTLKDVTSTEGREFFVGWLLNGESALTPAIDPNLKLNLYVSSRENNVIVVETVGGSTQYTINAGVTDTIEIDPMIAYVDKGSDQTEKVLRKGVRVYSQTNKVFTLLASNKNGITGDGTASFDATQVIPTDGLGSEYIVHTHELDRFANQFMIVGTENGTEVSIQLSADSKNFQATTAYPTITLNAKEVYLVTTARPNEDFSGTTICATKPVAVFNGSSSVLIPNQNGMTDDHAYEQATPISRWGKQFVVPMTANNTSANMLEMMAMKDNTTITISGHTTQTQKTISAGDTWRIELNTINCPSGAVYVEATQPITTYLYTTSAGRNSYTDPVTGAYGLQGDPSSTIIPPVEHFTDTTIFFTYKNPDEDAQLTPYVNIWAKASAVSSIKMDGNSIASHFAAVPNHSQYQFARIPVSEGTHTVTAPNKAFTGYTYALDAGQASMYTIGYNFLPVNDTLVLKDDLDQYLVRESEWNAHTLSPTEGGWPLDKVLLENGQYQLDSIFICEGTTLDFPIKTYTTWNKVRWEIEGSIQGSSYFRPKEQLAENVSRPEIQHQFTLLPKELNDEQYEDFEVRAILFRQPIMCNLPEELWERDTLNTIVRAMRQYNDTTWRAICVGDTVHFFKDTVWNGSHFTLQPTIFDTTATGGRYKYELGAQTITKSYISSGGCDSISTLKLFVCQRYFEHKDTVVCQDNTRGLDYGDFFKQYKINNSWPKGENTLKDVIHTKGCTQGPDFDEFRPHLPNFNGCDSTLELHLTVKEVIKNNTTENHCLSKGATYEWREKVSDRLIMTFSADTMVKDSVYILREYVKYVECEGCPPGGCDSVRNTLRLKWVSDAGNAVDKHVCQGKSLTYTNEDFTYTFNSNGKLCNTPYQVIGTVHIYEIVDGQRVTACAYDDTVTFWIDTVYQDQMTYDTICWDPQGAGQTYSWYNHPSFDAIPITRAGEFTYVDTMKTVTCDEGCGCDSICVLKLMVGRPYEEPTVAEICDDGAFTWQDTLFYGANYAGSIPEKSKQITGAYTSRRDTVTQYGCDSTLTFDLTVWSTYIAESKDTFVCANETYDFYGTLYNTEADPWVPGNTYSLEIHDASVHGCDSMVLHNVTVRYAYLNQQEANDTVCQVKDGFYDWTGHPNWTGSLSIANVGNYQIVDSMYTLLHCDSIVYKTIVVLPTYDLAFSRSMSSEDTCVWEGRIYAGQNAVFENPDGKQVIECTGITEIVDVLQTVAVGTHTCDSVRTLTLKVGQTFRDTVYDATCVNCGSFNWVITSPITGQDTTIIIADLPQAYEEKIYYDSLLTSMGYDSIYVLRLTGYPNYSFETGDSVCQGEEYTWADHDPMVYSLPYHRLFINGEAVTTIPTDIHGIIQVVDSMVTDTIFTNPKTGSIKPMHCDSVWTLTLRIDPTYNDRYVNLTDYRSMASNDTISHFDQPHTLFVGYDFDYTAAGITPDDLELLYDRVVYIPRNGGSTHLDSIRTTSVNGCDSVHYVQIAICEMQFVQLIDSIGDNNTTWHFGGQTGTTSRGQHTLPYVTGAVFHHYDDGTPVDYTVAEGRTMREYLFIDTLFSADGCDSIVHDLVRVFPTYRFPYDTSICSNKRYDWRTYTYLNRERTGSFYDSVGYFVGTHRFDSVYVLNLDVVPSGYWAFDTTICKNDTIDWYYQRVYYQNNGLSYVEAIYRDSNSLCGDVYHLDLHFAPFYGKELVEYDTICQSDTYRWISPGETKEHTEAVWNQDGERITNIPTDVAGDFVYYDSLKTKSCGCDSIYTLHLFVKPTYHFYDTTFMLCSSDTLDWHDRQYYYRGEANVYDTVFDLSTVYACDSNYYLRVHFDLSYDITDSLFLCSDAEHYTWEDIVFDDTLAASHYWDEPRDYFFTREYQTTVSGCDSIRHLKLRIAPSYDSIWTDTICTGETYYLFDQRLTTGGQYTDVQLNRFGCNTYYYLTLVERPLPDIHLNVEPVCVDEEGLANTYLIHYTFTQGDGPISYSIRYDSIARSLGFEDEEDVPITSNEQTLTLPVPTFTARDKYPRPGYYDATISFSNGVCLFDSLTTYPFTMEMRYPSWITTQHWNDAIFIMDSTLNGGYSFSAYQWYRNDSLLHGETKPYLYEPQFLHLGAAYSVALTRADDSVTVRTCPILPDLSGYYDKSPQQAYVSVVPTAVVKENPIVYILSNTGGTYKLLNPQGQLLTQGVFTPDEKGTYPVTLPASSGVYVFHLTEITTAGTGGDLSRTVKVIVQ